MCWMGGVCVLVLIFVFAECIKQGTDSSFFYDGMNAFSTREVFEKPVRKKGNGHSASLLILTQGAPDAE